MTDYNVILDAEIDPDAPLTSDLAYRFRNNPIAIAEGDADAPAMATGWMNYTGSEALTAIYDFAIDGAIASIETPDFEDGWEYRIFLSDIDTVSGTDIIYLDLYRETTAAYADHIFATDSISSEVTAYYDILMPRRAVLAHFVDIRWTAGTANDVDQVGDLARNGLASVRHSTAQKILKARIIPQSTNLSGGRIFLLRRQVGFTR